MVKLGEKIKSLRKQKNISQEVFANYLGVSFQSVSKWENGNTMPDVTMIPAIALFFDVSIDELFDFNLFETEKQVDNICKEAYKYRYSDVQRSQKILRDGLKRFPGNDVILNNLLYTLDYKTCANEAIDVCEALIKLTKEDSVKYDACRILALCYKIKGHEDLIKPTLKMIPEIYFSKLELMASLLDGEESYKAAQKQKNLSAENLVNMLIISGKYLKKQGKTEEAMLQFKIAKRVVNAFSDDFVENKYFKTTLFESMSEQRSEIEKLLK